MSYVRRLLSLFVFLPLALALSAPPTAGQYEVRKRRSDGFYDSYGVTLLDGQVIGQAAGVPAGVTATADWDTLTGRPGTSAGGNGADDAGKLLLFGSGGKITAADITGEIVRAAAVAVIGGDSQLIVNPTSIQFVTADGFACNLTPGTITAPRTWTLRDASGDIAFTSDLSDYVPVTRKVNGNALSADITINSISGNAGTATKLQTARALNGVSFDGSASITIPAAGSTLTDTVTVAKGGTGQTTAQAAINALMAASGALSQGDIFYFNGTNVVRLAAGTSGHYFKTQGSGANPTWAAAPVTTGANTFTGQQVINAGTITTSQPLTISQTWNAAVDFSALLVDVTISAFNNGPSSLFRLRMNNVDRFFVDHGGSTYIGGNTAASSTVLIDTNGRVITMRNGTRLDAEGDTSLYRDSAGVWAMRLGDTAHELRVYGAVTGSKYLSLKHDATNAIIRASSGNISIQTPLSLPSGSNARLGSATLVAGTVTVSNATVTSSTRVILTRSAIGGTVGNLSYTLSAGSSFTINSDSILDTSPVTYLLIENP